MVKGMSKELKHMQCCATCIHWSGPRESACVSNERVHANHSPKNLNHHGKCLNQKSGWRQQIRQASSKCSRWENWTVVA
jgi:hypothetical protein